MAQKECGNGHIFDPDIYSECPYCEHEGKTVDFGDISGDFSKSEAVETVEPETISPTTPASDIIDQPGHTIIIGPGIGSPEMGPVVGWIVCTSGKNIGRDYRLFSKTNKIGRSESMDVKISEDMTISSDTHAKIDYDILNNDFYLLPGNNSNTIYMNNTPVYEFKKLTPYDVLRFGKSEFMFVPFCCDKFKWSDNED